MRVGPTALAVAMLAAWGVPTPGRADVALTLDGGQLGPEGALTRQIADVVGAAEATTTPVLAIDAPPVVGDSYAVSGTVAYEDVSGEGYLELWSVFADGSRYFSRTLDARGPMAKLTGSSSARPFALPFSLGGRSEKPTRLELYVVLPAAGQVHLSGLRFESGLQRAPAWWSPQQAGWIGAVSGSALGILGAVIGTLCSMGRGRRFALGALAAMAGVGAVGALLGIAALAIGQPFAVWYPPLLGGCLAAVLGIVLRPTARRRFDDAARATASH
jgi:hypothetical protein